MSNFENKPKVRRKVIVDTEAKLVRMVKQMHKLDAFAFDTETNTTKVLGPNKDLIVVGISFSWGNSHNYYIPLGHRRSEDYGRQLDRSFVVQWLQEVFDRTDFTLVGQNLKFDMHVLKRLGIEIKTKDFFDTMIASWLCNENELKGLKEISMRLLKIGAETFNEVVGTVPGNVKKEFGLKGSNKATFDLVLIDDGVDYAIADAFNAWKLYVGFLGELEDEGMDEIYYQHYVPLIDICFRMEEKGVKVDQEILHEMADNIEKDLEDIKYRMFSLAGIEFNPASNQHLQELFFAYEKPDMKDKNGKIRKGSPNQHILDRTFGFKPVKYTQSGAPSTDNSTMSELAKQEFKNKRKLEGVELARMMLKFSTLEKLNTAFIRGLIEKGKIYDDGKVHPTINLVGTDSGRFSYSDPNCFDDKTEILTRRGFILFNDLEPSDKVAQWDDGIITFSSYEPVVKYFKGELVSVQNQHVDMVMTPDHRCLFQNRKRGWYTTRPAREFLSDYRILHAGEYVGGHVEIDHDMVRLIVAIQADAHFHYGLTFTFAKVRKYNRLKDILSSLSITPRIDKITPNEKYRGGKRYTVTISYDDVPEAVFTYIDNKIFPWELLELSRECLEVFRNELEFWGGLYTRGGQYCTVQEQNADVVQAIHSLCNVRALKSPYNFNYEQGTGSKAHIVYWTERNYGLTTNAKITNVHYEGNVYCVSVPSGYILVRRNGKVVVTGNCQQLPRPNENPDLERYQIRSMFIGSEYVADRRTVAYVSDDINDSKYWGERYSRKCKKIIAADYSNLEVRVLAHFCEDQNLLSMFAAGEDTHGSTAVNMFELDCTANEAKDLYPELRQAAKTLNFLLLYGGGARTLYENLKGSGLDLGAKKYLEEYGVRNGVDVAQAYIDKYFDAYKGVANFIRGQKKFAHRHEYVWTLLGRKRRLLQINGRDKGVVAYEERVATNASIQGSAGDITTSAQLRIDGNERMKEIGCEMLIQIHDELVFECPEEHCEEAIEIIKDLMENPFADYKGFELNLPLEVNASSGWSYQEAK